MQLNINIALYMHIVIEKTLYRLKNLLLTYNLSC